MPGKFDFEQDVDEEVLAADQQRAGGGLISLGADNARTRAHLEGKGCPGKEKDDTCCGCKVPKWSIITVFILVVVVFALLITLCCLIEVNTTNFWIAVAATICAGLAFLFGFHTLMLHPVIDPDYRPARA